MNLGDKPQLLLFSTETKLPFVMWQTNFIEGHMHVFLDILIPTQWQNFLPDSPLGMRAVLRVFYGRP